MYTENVRPLRDEEILKDYAQDTEEKSRIARSAKNHVTKGKWRMSDGNGETQSVQIGKYISRENFKSLPKSMQREY